MRVFVRQNWPLRKNFFWFFQPIFLARLKGMFWTPKLESGTLFSWRYDQNKIGPFSQFPSKISFVQDMMEAITQNCAKTKHPQKKIDKI